MLQHLLYVVSPSRLEETKRAVEKLNPKPFDGPSITLNYSFTHRLLENLVVNISLLDDLDGVTPFLRQHPVDLLIYDERGDDAIEAATAIRRIRSDVKSLSSLWGPDFNFPMSRIVTILNKTPDVETRGFELGRLNVRGILVQPKSTALILRWLRNILIHGVIRKNRVGIALGGGAMEGFLYQIGVIHALNLAMKRRTIYDCEIVSGVSSGSIAGAVLAAKVPITELVRALHDQPSAIPPLKLSILFDLAGSNILKRFTRLGLNFRKLKPAQWFAAISRAIPTGFFKGEHLETYIREILTKHGDGDDFRKLDHKFFVGVTDQDSFEHVTMGRKNLKDVPISEAVRASSALPPLFTPRSINGRMYIDGQITKSCNLEAVIEEDASLVFIIDPLKPFRQTTAGTADQQGGLFGIVQMIKALVSTRFENQLKAVSETFPDVDFIVFQPNEECAKLLSGSPLKTKLRTEIIESAYRGTLRQLRERHNVYQSKLSRYGFELHSSDDLRHLENHFDEIVFDNEDILI